MGTTRKQITFDLDTNALKIYYPSENWNNAYEIIRKHMTSNGFKWLQGSVYVSEKPIQAYHITRILDELIQKNSWLNVCMRDCRETTIGKEYDLNNLFNKSAAIATRNELKSKNGKTLKAVTDKAKQKLENNLNDRTIENNSSQSRGYFKR
ncbi:hypothetical protein [Oribacterium sinus]|jgi:virulence-associated protein 2|uniref:hypothetical protein n=1 Tax=Oribacterium sinus TaxID=237576 RepID=UPI0028EDDFF0|nr:hypothetical protein [Oribacterium sinus]